jgi:hypothetical protein
MSGPGRNLRASTGTRWWMMRSHRGLAGVKQRGQRAGGQVGAQMDKHQQHPHRQWQAPGPPGRCGSPRLGQDNDLADLADG